MLNHMRPACLDRSRYTKLEADAAEISATVMIILTVLSKSTLRRQPSHPSFSIITTHVALKRTD